MNKAKICCLIVSVVCCFLFCSCNSDLLFDKSEKIKDNTWNIFDKKTFKVKVEDKDRVSLYRFAVNITNNEEYKYNNIYFFLTTIYPDGKISVKDTIECELVKEDGKWKGKNMFGVIDNRFWFAQNVDFKQKGTYTFRLEQATKDTNLIGVKSVGLHIEKMPE